MRFLSASGYKQQPGLLHGRAAEANYRHNAASEGMLNRAADGEVVGRRLIVIGGLGFAGAVEQLKAEVHLRQHAKTAQTRNARSEEHTSELQSR